MPRPNPYPISGIKDPHLQRVLQDMVDRQSFLEREIERLGGAIPVGMAKRESPVEGIITIPSFENNGSIRVSPDGVIASFVNPIPSILDVSLTGGFFTDTAIRQTGANTTETDLSVKTIPANTFAKDGDFMLIISRMVYGANANGKRYRLYFGSNVMYDTGVITPNALSQLFFGILYREIPTTVSGCFTNLLANIATGSNVAATFASPVNFTVSNILKTTGQNSVATAGDVLQAGFFVIKGRARP